MEKASLPPILVFSTALNAKMALLGSLVWTGIH